MTELQNLLESMDPQAADAHVDKIKGDGEDSDYADLVRYCLERTEEHMIQLLKSHQSNEASVLWLIKGHLQCVEQLKGLIFGRLADMQPQEMGEE